jgi:rhodanese-related sulfurtransferase
MEHLPEYLQNHPYLAGLAVLMILAVTVYEIRARGLSYAAISPQDAIRLMNQGATVFDVRDAEAFSAGHIRHAKTLGKDQLEAAGEQFKKLKQKNVIVYCDQGVRAGAVVRQLQAQGFSQVFNLKGGLAAWRAENLPVEKA